MFQMNYNSNPHVNQSRHVRFDGMIHYYKNGWLSNKWVVVYAKLWSDSTLEWFQSKGSDKPVGSLQLGNLIPFICIGPQVRKVPTKKPKIEGTWTRDLLMAIATDQKASSVHWFYFDNGQNLRKWVSEITQTLPRWNNAMTNNYPRQNAVGTGISMNHEQDFHGMQLPPPYYEDSDAGRRNWEDSNKRIQMFLQMRNNKQKQQPRRSSFDNLFDDTLLNYGIGNFFIPMNFESDSSSSSEDSDDELNHHGNVHVSNFGDSTGVTIHSSSSDSMRPNSNELGSGFNNVQVHRFDL